MKVPSVAIIVAVTLSVLLSFSIAAKSDDEKENTKKMTAAGQKDDMSEMGDSQDIASGCVVLNVGGTKYMTSKANVESLGLSEDQKKVKDDEGNIFIDRDGALFRYILNYLREKQLILPEGFSEIDALDAEVAFFGMEELENEIEKYRKNQQHILWVNVIKFEDSVEGCGLMVTIQNHRNIPKIIQVTCSVNTYRRFKSKLTTLQIEDGAFVRESRCPGSSKENWLGHQERWTRGNEILTCFLRSEGFSVFETLEALGFRHSITVDGFMGYTHS